MKMILEWWIGVSLDELDEYLYVYKFGFDILMVMVKYYLNEGYYDFDFDFIEEIVGEVDKFLWMYVEVGFINVEIFVFLFKVLL